LYRILGGSVANSPEMSRRQFVTLVMGVLGSIMGAVIGLPAIGFLLSPALKQQAEDAWIPAGLLENYPVGTPTLFTFTRTKANGWEKTVNSYGVFIVRSSDTELEAFSNRCTHLSCRVNWLATANEFVCPCHDGHFGLSGAVTGGPPPRPLDKYEFKVEDGKLMIRFQEA
jgi:menaquinol-cytochrome c reductase iron-sulfur subunit